jgi:NAD+ kinase
VKIAVVIHPSRERASEVAAAFLSGAARHGLDAEPVTDDASAAAYDLVVGIGGDGTMLQAAAMAVAADVPVVGIDVGHVGYLAEIEPTDLERGITRIASGDYRRTHRMTLQASVPGRPAVLAVNDVVIEKSASPRVAFFDVQVDGLPFHTYRADALVLASPTGSTAYAFSAGGPVVDPALEALLLAPVAAHDLFNRPVVFPPGAVIRVTAGRDREVRVNTDGREFAELRPGEHVEVSRGERDVCFLSFGGRTFVEALKQEFGLDNA